MGYALPSQTAHGIHMRLRSRAFIMAQLPEEYDKGDLLESMNDEHQNKLEQDAAKEERSLLRWRWRRKPKNVAQKKKNELAGLADPERTVCFVSIDAGMGSDLLNVRVLKRLDELLPEQGNSGKRLCHLENLSISGTHTHSGPAGFLQYTLYQITSYGFFEETMSAFVEGIAQSILR